MKSLRDIFNVVGMMDKTICTSLQALHITLNPADYPGLDIVTLGDSIELKGLDWRGRLYLHAGQKLLDYAKVNNIDACPSNVSDAVKDIVEDGMVHAYQLCDRVMNE